MNQQMNAAVQAFQNKQYAQAIQICNQNKHIHPMFQLILASSLGMAGESIKSQKLFLELAKKYPTNPDVYFNHALILKNEGKFDLALTKAKQALNINQNYHPAWDLIGQIHLQLNDFPPAIAALKNSLKGAPGNITYILSLAQAYAKMAKFSDAVAILTPLLDKTENPAVYETAIVVAYQSKNTEFANAIYESARQAGRLSFVVLFYSALIDIDEKKYAAAQKKLNEIPPAETPDEERFSVKLNSAFCQFMLTNDHAVLGEFLEDISLASFRDLVFLGNIFESLGDTEKLQQIINSAQPSNNAERIQHDVLRIKLALLTKELAKAQAIFGELDSDYATTTSGRYLQVKLQEQLGDFKHSASLLEEINVKVESDSSFVDSFLHEVGTAKAELTHFSKQTKSSKDQMNLVFVVGFPRSGTTFLEHQLAQFGRCCNLEETHLVKRFYATLSKRAGNKTVTEWLTHQSNQEIEHVRSEFFSSIEEFQGNLNNFDWVLDKMPFNCLYLPMLHLLFPNAKFVWVHRHPKDIFVSCLKHEEIRLFNSEQFLDVFEPYNSLWLEWRKLDSELVFNLNYEDLVENFSDVFATLKAWLGLNRYEQQSDSQRLVLTPSYYQVREQTHRKSVNSFKRYEALPGINNPRFKVLEEKLGYE